ncbi:MAG: crossover junction endodeoxyribonuclease RuvC [Phycisphaerales bacterium JB040]
MRVLGIDPGLNITGFGCVEGEVLSETIVDAGVFRLAKAGAADSAESLSARLVELERDLKDLIEELKPDAVAVEAMFTNPKHPGTIVKMAHGRGVVLLTIKRSGTPVIELPPAEVKKGIAGHGQAKKAQMQDAIMHLFRLAEPPQPDMADALAIAVTALRREHARV